MKTATRNLSIEAGTTYRRTLRFYTDAARTTKLDITGYTFAAWITRGTFKIAFAITATDAENGVAEMVLEPEQTIAVEPGDYLFDMLAETPSGDVSKYMKGKATIYPTGTRLPDE